jgi:hypothetical protein
MVLRRGEGGKVSSKEEGAERMTRTGRILGAVALTSLAGCSSTSTGTDVGYDGGTSIGTATLSGAVTGTVPITAIAALSPSIDGGSYLYLTLNPPLEYPNPDPNPYFSCAAELPGSSLVAGSFTARVEINACRAYFSSFRSFQDWEVGSTIVVTITSPGPAYPNYGLPLFENYWPYPSGSLTVNLATYLPYAYSVETIAVTFGPPPD